MTPRQRGLISPEQLSVGRRGSECIADTANHGNKRYGCIVAHGDAVIESLTGSADDDCPMTGFAAHTLPSGHSIMGVITQLKLTSGVVVAYHA